MASLSEKHPSKAQLQHMLDAVTMERDRLLAAIDNISDEIWFADHHGNFTMINRAGLLEFDLNGRHGVNVAMLAEGLEIFRNDGSPRPVDEAPPLRALKGEIIRDEEEIVLTPREGELRYRKVNSSPVHDSEGELIGSISVVRDITAGKRTEQALQASDIMYQTLFQGSKAGILVADAQTKRFLYANPAICAMLGYMPDEFLRLGVADIHPPATLPATMLAFDEMVKGTRNLVEAQCLCKNGSVLEVSISSSIATVNGQTHVFGFFTDITERRQTETALRESEEKYRKLHESMRDAFVRVNMNGLLIEYNKAYQEMLGYPDEELRRLTYCIVREIHGIQNAVGDPCQKLFLLYK